MGSLLTLYSLEADNLLNLCLLSTAHRFIGRQAAFHAMQNAITVRLSLRIQWLPVSNGATHAASVTIARRAARTTAGLRRCPRFMCLTGWREGFHPAFLLLGHPRLVVESCKTNLSLAPVISFCFTVFWFPLSLLLMWCVYNLPSSLSPHPVQSLYNAQFRFCESSFPFSFSYFSSFLAT